VYCVKFNGRYGILKMVLTGSVCYDFAHKYALSTHLKVGPQLHIFHMHNIYIPTVWPGSTIFFRLID